MNLVKIQNDRKPNWIEVYVSEGVVTNVIFHERMELCEVIASIKDDWAERKFDPETQENTIWNFYDEIVWSYGSYLNGDYDED